MLEHFIQKIFCYIEQSVHNVGVLLYLPPPLLGQDMTQGFKQSLTGLNSEFSFS